MKLYGFVEYLENPLSLYGVYWEEGRLYGTVCPVCGGRLVLGEKTRRARITKCTN